MSPNGKKKRNGKLVITISVMIGVIVILINLLQGIVINQFLQKKLLSENIERYSELSLNYSRIIKQSLDEMQIKLDYYLQQDVLATEDNDQIVSWLTAHEKNRPEVFQYVGWVDDKGNMYTDTGNVTKISDRDYFINVVQKGMDLFIDNPVVSRTTNSTIIHIARPVKINGRIIGEMVGVIDMTHVSSIMNEIKSGNDLLVTLFSGDGQFMGMVGNAELMGMDKSSPEDIEKVNVQINTDVRAGKNGYLWVEVKGAPATAMFYAPIAYTTWSVSITISKLSILALSLQVQNLLIIFSTLMTIGVIGAVLLSVYYSLKPLKILEASIREIATGNADLTKRIELNANNEIGRVVEGFNSFTEKLQTIMSAMKTSKDELVSAGNDLNNSTSNTASSITEIISNIESMGNNINTQTNIVSETAGAVNEIASNIESLNNMIESQSSAVSQASAAVEQMIGNINSVSNSVRKMTDEFNDLQVRVGNGIQKQDAVNDKIQVIESESKTLQEANAVIANIAAQTNLLAMNAAIEAAHAGEAGKGFSVVADEIRKLSENSSKQSNSIGLQLKTIQESISEIVTVSKEAKDAFSLVSNGINGTNDLVKEISLSMEEQSEGSKQISVALAHMNDTSAEVQNSSQEMSAGNKTILDEIKRLQDATFSMKAGMEEMSVGADLINKTGSSLSEISEKMENSISQIGGQVDQFKV